MNDLAVAGHCGVDATQPNDYPYRNTTLSAASGGDVDRQCHDADVKP